MIRFRYVQAEGESHPSVSVDGHEIADKLSALSLEAHPGRAAVRLDMLAWRGCEVDIPAEIALTIKAAEPGIVEIERSDDGKTQRVRFQPAPPQETT